MSAEASSLAGTSSSATSPLIYDDNRISIEGDTDVAFTEDVAQALRGLRLARPDRRLDPRRHRLHRGRPRRCTTRSSTADDGHRPAQPHRAPHGHRLAGAARAEHRHLPRLRARRRRGRGHQEDPRLRPRAALRGPRRRPRRTPAPRRPRQGGAGRLGGAVRRLGRARNRRAATRCYERMQTRALPDGWADGAADVRRRRQGRRDPQGLRRGAQRGRRRCCPSCGAARPTSPSPTTPPSRASRPSSRPTARPTSAPGDPVRPGAALRHPRARHGRDHERHRAARRHPRLRRHVPDVLRLHAPARSGSPR